MSKSKIPTLNEHFKNMGFSLEPLELIKVRQYAEFVREETLNLAAEEAKCHTGNIFAGMVGIDSSEIDKQSILDLVTHPNLEIK